MKQRLAELDEQIMAAYAGGTLHLLPSLYQQAGEVALAAGQVDQGCFYLTHAYVFALEQGHGSAREIHETLCSFDREI